MNTVAKKRSSKHRSAKRRRRDSKRRRRSRPTRAPASPDSGIVFVSGSFGGHGIEDDDCPYCQVQREMGIVDGQQLSDEEYLAFRARVDELIAAGAPSGEVKTVEELERYRVWIDARLEAEGRPYGLDAMHQMSDEEFTEHMGRVMELSAEFETLH